MTAKLRNALALAHSMVHSGERCSEQSHAEISEALAATPDAPLSHPDCALCGRAITGAGGDPATHIGCCMADLEDDGASCCRASGLDALRMFGDIYEVNGRDEWHGHDCIYRKTWAMYDGDEHDDLRCVQARAALDATPDAPLDVERLRVALWGMHFDDLEVGRLAERIASAYEHARQASRGEHLFDESCPHCAREYAATLDHREPTAKAQEYVP